MKPQQISAVGTCTLHTSVLLPCAISRISRSPTEPGLSAWKSSCLGPGTCQIPSEKPGVRSKGSEQ